MPTPLDDLGSRPFSFYPPIANIDNNQWRLRRINWSEIQVVNSRSGEEIWIPRRFVGEVARTDDPVRIVGLVKDLEYKSGAVVPVVRRVIEMPRAVNGPARSFAPAAVDGSSHVAPVVGIRVETTASRFRLVAAGILACVCAAVVFRDGPFHANSNMAAARPLELGLSPQDDYQSIVSKLGAPAEDRWHATGTPYCLLWYPQRSVALILLGPDRFTARYAGAIDRSGHVVQSVTLPDGTDSAPVLRKLRAL